jgi:hypothetical protein
MLLNLFTQTNNEFEKDIQIEELFENSDQSSYSESQIEYLLYRRDNKLNLFFAQVNEIADFPNFEPVVAKRILEYVQKNPNTTISKLSKELDLTNEQSFILSYCSYIDKNQFPTQTHLASRSRTNISFNNIDGFENGKFLGSKLDYSSRTYFTYNLYNFGLILDKDAGEVNNFDFYSGFINYKTNNLNLIFGDFTYELGMGNILWREFPERKGIDILSPAVKFGKGAVPNRSTLDYSLFRGIAVDYSINLTNKSKFLISSFFSRANRAATIDSSNQIATSFYTMGLYRTRSEIAKKNSLREEAYSSNFSFQNEKILTGIGFLSLNYQYPILSSSSSAFYGQTGFLKTAFIRYLDTLISIGSELSLDAGNKIGGKLGAVFDFGNYSLTFHLRSFDAHFRSPFGRIFGEFSYPANELGLYTGLKYNISKVKTLSTYIDFFKTYSPTYSVNSIVYGGSIFSQYDLKITKNSTYSLRLFYENKTNSKNINNNPHIYQQQKINLRNEFQYSFHNFKTRFRLEACYLNNMDVISDEVGLASFVEVSYQYKTYELFTRFSYYSTDSYESAIWQYEYFINGLLYSFPAYLDGSRIIVGLTSKLFNLFNLSLIYYNNAKNNVSSLGSGYDEIFSNASNNLVLQIEINY